MQEQPIHHPDPAQNQPVSDTLYEQMLVTSILLFYRSLQLIAEVGNQSALDLTIFRNGRINSGLAQVIETIETCGSGLECLPAPPPGAKDEDRGFRDFGGEVRGYATALNRLASAAPGTEREIASDDLQKRGNAVKTSFSNIVDAIERVFPGRLDCVLGTDNVPQR